MSWADFDGPALTNLIGRSPESLTLKERLEMVGKWVAVELYSAHTLPLREIRAIGETSAECIVQLSGDGLNPTHYEFVQLGPPY